MPRWKAAFRLASSGVPEFTATGVPEFTGEAPTPASKQQQAELLLKSGGASVVLPKAEGLVVSLPVAPPNVQFL